MELKIIQDNNFYVDLPVYMSLRRDIAAVVLLMSDFYSPSILQSWACSMNRGEEECILVIGRKVRGKETTRKTKMEVGG
jgi:hypothetical protein